MARPVSHQPVLLDRVVSLLRPRPGAVLVDATLGLGGHAEALLEAVGAEGSVVGIDRDPQAIALARRRLARFGDAFTALAGNHEEIQPLLASAGIFAVDGILFDLGVSSMQLDDPRRGFSFRFDGPLDMRMDPQSGKSAAQLLEEVDESELRRILWEYGEERRAGAIARAVARERSARPIRTTGQLAEIVERVLGARARRFRIHPATRTFQALRIAVNHEVEGLEALVTRSASLLRRGGRLAALSYHSLEDRAVKRALRAMAHRCTCPPKLPKCACGKENLVRLVTHRPVRPDEAEVRANPRARSARLRVAERL